MMRTSLRRAVETSENLVELQRRLDALVSARAPGWIETDHIISTVGGMGRLWKVTEAGTDVAWTTILHCLIQLLAAPTDAALWHRIAEYATITATSTSIGEIEQHDH